MEIYASVKFDAAHWLPNVPADHKCGSMHGHSYSVDVHICGPVGPETGWVMDFADIKQALYPLRDQLDHSVLNDIEGLENPTAEILARWIWRRLQPAIPWLSKLVIHETDTTGCIYRGEDEGV